MRRTTGQASRPISATGSSAGDARWPCSSYEAEVDFHSHSHGDGLAVFVAGRELPFPDGSYGLFVQAQSEALHHSGIHYFAVRVDHDLEHHHPLEFRCSGGFGVIGLNLMHKLRLGHAIAAVISAVGPRRALARRTGRAHGIGRSISDRLIKRM